MVYVLWRMLPGRAEAVPSAWIWLLTAGLLLAALTLVVLSVDFGAPRTGSYVPPRLGEDGRVVPGFIAPAAQP
jgi:hypothetical protein